MKKFKEMKRLYQTITQGVISETKENSFTISGLTADFDRLLELSWKVLKEYMFLELGIKDAKTGSPKTIIRLAYAEKLIDDEDMWIKLINDRNDDAHIYSESAARAYASRIVRDYLSFFKAFILKMEELIPKDNSFIETPKSFICGLKHLI